MVPLHLIMDNYGTHKHANVQAWLKRHPRFVPHFVPTSASWMNLVERSFGHLDNPAMRRGVFLSVADLQTPIAAFLKAWNQAPPFVWTATVQSIQEKLARRRRTLEIVQPGSTSAKSNSRPDHSMSSYFADTPLNELAPQRPDSRLFESAV